MRNLLLVLCLLPTVLFGKDIGISVESPALGSIIGGSGNWAEELFLTFLVAGFLLLIAQWIKYADKMKKIRPLEVLPNLERGEMVPILRDGHLELIPESFEENSRNFELLWRLEKGTGNEVGKIGFLNLEQSEKSIQLFFEVNPDSRDDVHLLSLIEQACSYIWTKWEADEIQVIRAYIDEADLMGEAILGSLGFIESEVEGETIEFSFYRR